MTDIGDTVMGFEMLNGITYVGEIKYDSEYLGKFIMRDVTFHKTSEVHAKYSNNLPSSRPHSFLRTLHFEHNLAIKNNNHCTSLILNLDNAIAQYAIAEELIAGSNVYENGKLTTPEDFTLNLRLKGLSRNDLLGLAFGTHSPYHLGHLELHKKIADAYDRMQIGILFPDPNDPKLGGRDLRDIFSYNVREEMIQAALDEIGCLDKAKIIPFYTTKYHSEKEFWEPIDGDKDSVVFHRPVPFDEKEKKKIKRYTDMGLKLLEVSATAYRSYRPQQDVIMPYSSTIIRTMMKQGNEEWRKMVPGCVELYINRNHLYEKLRDLTADAQRKT